MKKPKAKQPKITKVKKLEPKQKKQLVKEVASSVAAPPLRKPAPKVNLTHLALAGIKDKKPNVNAFQLPPKPPWVPKGAAMAMDSVVGTDWAAQVISSSFSEGLQFLGYPYLSELAQRPEYRVISETIAGEMTRRWIKLKATDDDDGKKKNSKLDELNDEFERLEVRDNFRKLAVQDGFFGRSHLYLDLGTTDDRQELRTPIGDGKNAFSKAKVAKGALKRISTVEAVWAYPTSYDSSNPLKPDWYNPQHWFVMGNELHVSRLLTFVGREVPDLLKPAYSFGGLSMSQIAKPYVDNWLTTRQSVNDLIHSFVVWGLKTNLSESLTPGGEQVFQRIALFNLLRDNKGTFLIDKDTEEFFNQTAPLGSLDALQAQAQEHMCAVSRIPTVKLLGIQPAGLNASSEGEIRTFYDSIHAYQEAFFTRNLRRLLHFVQLSLWGEVDETITFDYEPLWSLDDEKKATVRKTDVETGQILVDSGIVSQEEERARIANDPDSLYPALDVNDMPDLEQEESEGLVPEGGGHVTAELQAEEQQTTEQKPPMKAAA